MLKVKMKYYEKYLSAVMWQLKEEIFGGVEHGNQVLGKTL